MHTPHTLPLPPAACLQVGSLVMGPEFNPQFEQLYTVFMRQLVAVVPPGVNIPEAYERGSDDQQKFVQNLALFFTGFFKVRGASRGGPAAGVAHMAPCHAVPWLGKVPGHSASHMRMHA